MMQPMLILLTLLPAICLSEATIGTLFSSNKTLSNLKVYNGRSVTQAEYDSTFPFVVSLQVYSTGSNFHFCTGTFITTRHILCAAHCVSDTRPVTVMVGTPNIDDRTGTTYDVKETYVHHQYHLIEDHNGGVVSIAADIAIFELATEATNQKHFSKVLGLNYQSSQILHNLPATFVGWGATSSTSGIPSNLQRADATLVTRQGNPSFCNADAGFICADGSAYRSGVCGGDSGGPLMTKLGSDFVQVGVASYASCEGGFAAYALTSDYAAWINGVIDGSSSPTDQNGDCPGGCMSDNPCLINPGTCIDGVCHFYNFLPEGSACGVGLTCQRFQCLPR